MSWLENDSHVHFFRVDFKQQSRSDWPGFSKVGQTGLVMVCDQVSLVGK